LSDAPEPAIDVRDCCRLLDERDIPIGEMGDMEDVEAARLLSIPWGVRAAVVVVVVVTSWGDDDPP